MSERYFSSYDGKTVMADVDVNGNSLELTIEDEKVKAIGNIPVGGGDESVWTDETFNALSDDNGGNILDENDEAIGDEEAETLWTSRDGVGFKAERAEADINGNSLELHVNAEGKIDKIGDKYIEGTGEAPVDAYSKEETNALLDDKVDKVSGKGLSANDYTNADKGKLDNIESGAEANLIESVSVAGTALEIESKSVNVPEAGGTTGAWVKGVVSGEDTARWDSWVSAVFPIIPKPNIVVIGGRTYPTVKIGNQMWMAENLNLTWPTLELNQTTVSKSKTRANYYGNASSAEGTKGLLYNGPAVTYIESNSDILEIPSGWHVATLNDWNTLYATVGGTSVAAKKLKTTSGWAYDGNGTDDYGFAAAPGGLGQESAFSSDVTFQNGTDKAFYWASALATVGRYYALLQTGDNAQCDMFSKISTLLSVRLVKNLA